MMSPEELPATAPDPTFVDPKAVPVEWAGVLPDDRTLSVVFGHGSWQGFHHVETSEDAESVSVTVFVGTKPSIAARLAAGEKLYFTMQRIVRRTEVTLATPLAGREIRDGATGIEVES